MKNFHKQLTENDLWLKYFSLIYLILPYYIFFIGWTNYYIGFAAILILSFATYKTMIFYKKKDTCEKAVFENLDRINSTRLALIIMLIAAWTFLSGSGGYYLQNGDYQKHNAIIKELIDLPWPPTYIDHSKNLYHLVYYVAYYLPAVTIAKFTSLNLINLLTFFWTFIGVLLSALWLLKIVNKISIRIVFIFIIFSGLDIIGALFNNQNLALSLTEHIEWWVGYGFWQYSSNTSMLWWVPQHAIPCWLITSMILHLYNSNKSYTPFIFIAALSCLWSPFIMIGIIPLCFISLFKNRFHYNSFKQYLSFENTIAPLFMFIVFGIYYSSHLLSDNSGFVWNLHRWSEIWYRYIIFIIVEFGLFAVLISTDFTLFNRKQKMLFITTTLTLSIIPFYIFGYYNDFGMRSAPPSLFILQILFINFLFIEQCRKRYWKKKVAILLVIIGSITGIREISRTIIHTKKISHHKFGFIPITKINPIHASQYFGSKQNNLSRYILKDQAVNRILPDKIKFYLKKK